jgi:small conductance mechanosensitive channel
MALWETFEANLIYIEAAVLVIVAILVERLISRYLKRISKRKEWPPHVTNGLILIFRLLILLGSIATVLRIGGIPPDWLVAYSALGGAAIGFASQRTLGNFLAGIFIFVTHPFRVNDYVKVDNVEGIVDEITFNFTKILTRSNTLVFISNLRILDQTVINYKYQGGGANLYCYNIELTFDHSLSANILEKTFDGVIARFEKELPKKPEYAQLSVGAFERKYAFYLYVKKPREIFTVNPEFVKRITEAWDNARKK